MSLASEVNSAGVLAPRRRRGITSRRYTLALIVGDYLAGWLGFLGGLVLLNLVTRNSVNRLDHFLTNVRHGVWFPVGIVLGMAVTSGYRVSRRSPTQNAFSDFKDVAMATSVGGFVALTMSYVAHHLTRWEIQVPTQVIVAVGTTSLVIAGYRALLRSFVMQKRPMRIIVIDDGTNYQRIATHLHLQRGVKLLGRVTTGEIEEGCLGTIADIEEICEEHNVDRAIFGAINEMSAETARWYRRTTELVDTALVPRMFELISWRSRLTDLSGLSMLEMAPRHVSLLDRFLKRVFDVVVGLALLIVTLPVSLVIAVLVRLTSRGPVIFKQERLGRNQSHFTIYKFRTMRVAAASPVSLDVNDDPDSPLYVTRAKLQESNRLTPFGGFLRRTGLDEIPQFLNVVLGSMSIVGPRPFIPSESEIHDPHLARRFEVRPGITGLWQVSGRNNLTADELRELDYLYVSAWSLWWDVKICFDTPRAMLRGLGAY